MRRRIQFTPLGIAVLGAILILAITAPLFLQALRAANAEADFRAQLGAKETR